MSQPEGYDPPRDNTMNSLYSWAKRLGPSPELPDSLKDAHYTAC